MNEVIATFEILKGMKSKSPHGHIEVRKPYGDHPNHYGIYFFFGVHPRGFTPVPSCVGPTLAIERAAEMAIPFADQNGCKWVYREWEEDGEIHSSWTPANPAEWRKLREEHNSPVPLPS